MAIKKGRIALIVISLMLMLSVLSGCVTKLAVDAPALWKVTAPAGQQMYLFGTIHVATDDLYPLPDI